MLLRPLVSVCVSSLCLPVVEIIHHQKLLLYMPYTNSSSVIWLKSFNIWSFFGVYSNVGTVETYIIFSWEVFKSGSKNFSCFLSNASSPVSFCLRFFFMSSCYFTTFETNSWCSLNILALSFASIYLLENITLWIVNINREIFLFFIIKVDVFK